MLWYILVPISLFFFGKDILFGEFPPSGALDWFMSCLMLLLLSGFIVGGICTGIAFAVGTAFDAHAVQQASQELVAIRDKDGFQGRFFLGSGVIKGDQYYFYYARLADGGFKPGKVYAGDGCRVYEQNRKDAMLVTYSWELNKSWAWLVGLPTATGGYSYDFYVPKGTIRTGYTM